MLKGIFKNILPLFILLVLYLVFRFTVGKQVLYTVDNYISNALVAYSYEGVTLKEIKSKKISLGSDITSDVSKSQTNEYLSGSVGIQTSNPKILAMKKFLLDYNSPMYPYADVLVNEADKYGLDWRLVASISGVESAFGNLIPPRSNNGWGWRGGPGGAYSNFSTWGEGIKTVTSRLALGYGTTLTPFQIEPVYCPPCYANPAHAWANGVTRFMSELSYYLENLEKI